MTNTNKINQPTIEPTDPLTKLLIGAVVVLELIIFLVAAYLAFNLPSDGVRVGFVLLAALLLPLLVIGDWFGQNTARGMAHGLDLALDASARVMNTAIGARTERYHFKDPASPPMPANVPFDPNALPPIVLHGNGHGNPSPDLNGEIVA